ncbi:hypothetical protein Salat_1264400 [Sesamum alatum]|uniref:Uncharacterized protein n=1 Tax=Sesamum alatum TaxID=300844 RepID=A0AAE1YGJ2_9LAMI|nr:hypothetical protein Salat_1264400 [Sesamum alatum]
MNNVIYVDDEDDCNGDSEIDPQYVHFLSRLKEHKKSYVLESENNGVPAFIKYEAETDLVDGVEHENRIKVRRSIKAKRKLKGKDVVEGKKEKVQSQKESIEVFKKEKLMEEDDVHDLGGPSACDEFKKQVLNILKKSYDKDEYNKFCEAVRVGSYFEYHPGQSKIL